MHGLSTVFVKRLGTENRITLSNALERNRRAERSPIFKLNSSEELASQISDYFYQAFGMDLVVNRNDMQTIPLHVGNAPDKKAYTMDQQDEYYKRVFALPKLQEQGDGMRSFVSLLLDTFTSEYSITLIDEPEAFLHPPQARLMGKMLANHNPKERQLFISTHSEDFLQGLLDAENDNVTVVAITDFDILDSSQNMKALSTAFGIDWDTQLKTDMQVIYDSMNAQKSAGKSSWDYIKKTGKAGFVGEAPAAYEKVEKLCKSYGLFIVPVGEMECFDKTINKEKKDWVYHVLENYELGTETNLESARKFIKESVDFKLI